MGRIIITLSTGIILQICLFRSVSSESECCACTGLEADAGTYTTDDDDLDVDYEFNLETVFPGSLVKEIMINTLKETTAVIDSLPDTIPHEKISIIKRLIQDYQTGIVPPGLVDNLKKLVLKYGTETGTGGVEKIQNIIKVLRLQLGLEKSIEVMIAYGKQMDLTLSTLIKKLQKSFRSHHKTSRFLSEIDNYLVQQKSSVSTQITKFLYKMLESYGYEHKNMLHDSSSNTSDAVITESDFIKQISESKNSTVTFKVKKDRECHSQVYCTDRVMSSVCGSGGGVCQVWLALGSSDNEDSFTCSISVGSCDPRPTVSKLTTTQIITALKSSGTCETWVDFPEECIPQLFCLHPRILKEVAPYGGGSCFTQVRGKVCSITWKGIPKVDNSLEVLKSWREVDIKQGALNQKGIDFRVDYPEQCENFCTDMLKSFDTACQGTKFECCIKITSHGDGVHACNLKHTCFNTYSNRAMIDPVTTITAEELSSKDETIEVPSVPVEVKSVNKTIYLENESELQLENFGDYSEDEYEDKPKNGKLITARSMVNAETKQDTEITPRIRTEVEREGGKVKDIKIHIDI